MHYLRDMDLLVFEQTVTGTAGRTVPQPKGGTDGAPVLAYVFPTTLKAEDVGFSSIEGIVALAATSHPDFDDTPLWDENNNLDYRVAAYLQANATNNDLSMLGVYQVYSVNSGDLSLPYSTQPQ